MTLPLILLMEDSDPAGREAFLEVFRDDCLTDAQCEDILGQVRDGQYSEKTRQEASVYVEKAKACLAGFDPCEEVVVLAQAADFVLTRTK